MSDGEIRDMNQKEFRKEFPSGWMELTRYETLVLVLDALLESPTSREFTEGELSEKAGPSKKSIQTHIDSLVDLGIIEKLEAGRDETRFSINNKNPITRELYTLNRIVNEVKNGEISKTVKESPADKNINTADVTGGNSNYNIPNEQVKSQPVKESGGSSFSKMAGG